MADFSKFLAILVYLSLGSSVRAEKDLEVLFRYENVALSELMFVYGELTKKRVSYADPRLKDLAISVNCSVKLPALTAIKYLESSFFVLGFEIDPIGADEVRVSQYAKLIDEEIPAVPVTRDRTVLPPTTETSRKEK